MSIFMIDVSTNNGIIDWKKVRSAGVEGAMIKATQGHAHSFNGYLFTDSKFAMNITNAYANGIKCGAYHWLTAKTVAESTREANYFLSAIRPYKSKIELFAAVDVEDDKYFKGLNKNELTAIVNRFCEVIQSEGYVPIVYTNRNYLTSKLNGTEIVNRWKMWQAHWSTYKPNDAGKNLMIWQNEVRGSAADVRDGRATVVGSVDGVKGAIDCNIGYYTDKDITISKSVQPTLTQPIQPQPIEPKPSQPVVTSPTNKPKALKKGDRVKVLNNYIYNTNSKFTLYFPWYEVLYTPTSNRVVIGRNGIITAAVDIKNIELIN